MKKKLLCCALLAGFGMAQSVMAQDYDDRYYLTAGGGVGYFDEDRAVTDELFGQVGFGRFFTPNISVDLELWHSDPVLSGSDGDNERNWELSSLSLVGRYHFIQDGRSWNPYIAAGIGATEHHDGTRTQPVQFGYNPSRVGTNLSMLVGVGMQKDLGYASLRAEVGAKMDLDDEGRTSDYYADGSVSYTHLPSPRD